MGAALEYKHTRVDLSQTAHAVFVIADKSQWSLVLIGRLVYQARDCQAICKANDSRSSQAALTMLLNSSAINLALSCH